MFETKPEEMRMLPSRNNNYNNESFWGLSQDEFNKLKKILITQDLPLQEVLRTFGGLVDINDKEDLEKLFIEVGQWRSDKIDELSKEYNY